jgi:hypothetical protein
MRVTTVRAPFVAVMAIGQNTHGTLFIFPSARPS